MESRTFLVYLSDNLIRYLGKSLPNKASRYEAFQYIIGKQKEKIDLDRDGGAFLLRSVTFPNAGTGAETLSFRSSKRSKTKG